MAANLRLILSCKYPWKVLVSRTGVIAKLPGCQQPRRLLNSLSGSSRIEASRKRACIGTVCTHTCHTQCIDQACTPIAPHPREEYGFSARALQTTLPSVETIDAVLDVFEQKSEEGMQHVQLAAMLDNLLTAASKSNSTADISSDARCRKFLDHVVQEVPNFTADTVVSCFYACGKHDFRETRLLSALCDAIVEKFHSIPTEKLDSIYQVLKRLKLKKKSEQISKVAAERVFSSNVRSATTACFSTATVTSLVHSICIGGAWSKEYSLPLNSYVNTRLSEFKPRDLFFLLEDLIRQGAAEELLWSVGEMVAGWIMMTQLDPSGLTRVCWLYGKALVYHTAVFEALHEKIVSVDKQSLSPRLLATAAWAFARVRFYSPALMERIAVLSLATLNKFKFSQNLSMLAYAFAYLNHPHKELLSAISEKVCANQKFLSNSHACHNIAWACMVVGLYPRKLLEHVFTSTSFDRGKNLRLCSQVMPRIRRNGLGTKLYHFC